MTSEELEYSLSQYHDGTLGPVERAKLDEVLASDASVRAILGEYQKLDALVKRSPGLPAMNWDAVQTRISDALSNEKAPVRNSFRIYLRSAAAIAVAAIVVLGIMIPAFTPTDRGYRTRHRNIDVTVGPVGAVALSTSNHNEVAVTSGPQPVNSALAEVSIGPSAQMADAGMRYDDAFSTRPSHIVIAASPEDAQDASNPAPF